MANTLDMKEELLELLTRSLDEELSAEERMRLETALATHGWLRQEQQKLLQMRALFAQWQPKSNPDFADRVMQVVNQEKERESGALFVRLFPRVAVACALFFALGLGAFYLSEGSLSTDALIGLDDWSVEDVYSMTDTE